MTEPDVRQLIAASQEIAAAIAGRDVAVLARLLAPGFTHRTHGGDAVSTDAFLSGIIAIPGEIEFVNLEQLQVDVTPGGALVTGIQHARLSIEGKTVNDRRRFIDWFVSIDGEWRLQAAVDLPQQEPS